MVSNEYLKQFMAQFPHEGLTFDDVSLVTQYADFLPDDSDIRTKLSERISLNMPFISAAMDTVTESEQAIAMAMLGGIGVIHKNLTHEAQAQQVSIVKHHLNGLIVDPIVFRDTDSLATVQAQKVERAIKFSGFPILDADDSLVGILTSADVKFARDPSTPLTSIMTSEVITASPDTTVEEAYRIMMEKRIGKLPLVAKGKLVGLYSFSDVKLLVEDDRPLYTRDSHFRLRAAAAVSAGDHARTERLADEDVDVIVIDSAHGHSRGIMDMCAWVRKHYPDIDVIAGNIATAEAAVALRDAGAHAVKVGIGPGSICTTRVVCGVGVPQITAVNECAQALEGSIPVIADGGIRHSGDVPKALVVGADTVMLGSILAGTEESPGEKIIHQGRQYVVYRGMGSLAAMREGAGSRERYGQANTGNDDLVPQGIEGIVPYAGTVKKVMTQFCGGLRSSLGYSGCRTIGELQSRGRLVRVSSAGLHEAHPHDVKIMKEAPNYRS